ncbi:uncharacterized protein LOC116850718 [Odontomachus brunneus]|uniref:uncharacterized protein LOC116850718 n=1 Tax=Odontomachus brunneus TaxID=486640 RepID=UPI0013F265AD|nr:uncharacterized protein LOC116850718 [Odontomachus brunneus]
MFCIGISHRSRSSYKFICKYIPCPSLNTLNKELQSIPLDTGCNKIMYQYLHLAAREIDPKDLNVIIIWDEMSLQPAIFYNKKSNKIIRFEDWGMRRTRKFADHAILFYMRCLASGNRMPLGYGFCNSTTCTIQLVRCIKQWISFVIKCGFRPVANVCDQGGPDTAAINMLIKESNDVRHKQHQNSKNTFLVENKEIIPLYDYVHLQKGILCIMG